MRVARRHHLAVLLLAASVVAGCSSSDGSESDAAPSTEGFPVSLDNCGHDVKLSERPQRIVTIKSSATEMALALGAGDRIVGTAFSDGPLPDDLADAGGDLEVISDQAPSSEAVLGLEPDLVYGGWESNFAPEAAGDRDKLAGLGVATYVSPSACKEQGYKPKKLTFDDVFDEIEQAGEVLGESDAADALVTDQREQLGEVPRSDAGLSALWYSSGTDTPYVGAGSGAPAMIMDAVGLDNVAGDVDDTWTSLSWEAIADRDPDVIVLVDATWNSADDKIAMLESDPRTSQLTAVQERRYLTVPFAATEAGVRNVAAAQSLADQLADLPATDGS